MLVVVPILSHLKIVIVWNVGGSSENVVIKHKLEMWLSPSLHPQN